MKKRSAEFAWIFRLWLSTPLQKKAEKGTFYIGGIDWGRFRRWRGERSLVMVVPLRVRSIARTLRVRGPYSYRSLLALFFKGRTVLIMAGRRTSSGVAHLWSEWWKKRRTFRDCGKTEASPQREECARKVLIMAKESDGREHSNCGGFRSSND